jgi:hypothetical protein
MKHYVQIELGCQAKTCEGSTQVCWYCDTYGDGAWCNLFGAELHEIHGATGLVPKRLPACLEAEKQEKR